MRASSAYCLFLIFFLILAWSNETAAQEAPTIQVCSGPQEFCVDQPFFEICVTIDVDPLFTDPIDHFEIDWGDGSDVTVVPAGANPPNQFHTYDLSEFFGTCQYEIDEFAVRLETFLTDGSDLNSAFFPTFRNPPRAQIADGQSVLCVGEEHCFTDSSCPAENLMLVEWDFGDGNTSTESGCHTYTAPGTYFVSLTVENDCGMDTAMDTVTVIAPAVAGAGVTDGVENANTDPYQVCLDGGTALVTLDGAGGSSNAASYFWEVIQGTGYQWVFEDEITSPIVPDQQIIFTDEGLFQLMLTVDNACGQPSYDTLSFEVLGGGFSLNPQEDGCVSLSYTPSPLEDNVIYTINGMETSTFPVELSPDTYIVEVTGASSLCESGTLRDTFLVLNQEVAMILTPDTTLCALDGDFSFAATPENGEWRIDGVLFSGTLDPADYGEGEHVITYGNEPCITTDTMIFTIVDPGIEMPADTELCIDEDPVTFTAQPANGTWSGSVVTPAGVFDPALSGIGEFVLYYSVENSLLPACSNIDSLLVTVAELSVDFAVASCEGTSHCFELTEPLDFTSVQWDFDGTGTSSAAAPCHTFPAAQTYEVTATVVRGACTETFSQSVTIEDPPVADFGLDYDPGLCAPLAVTFTNNSSGSNLIYEWTLNGEFLSDAVLPDPLLLDAVEMDTPYEIQLLVRNDCDTDVQSETLIVRPRPVSIIGTDQNQYCSGDTVFLANVSTGNPTSYQWLLDGELISTDSIEPVISHIATEADTIEICLVTMNSCGEDILCLEREIMPTDVSSFFHTAPTDVCAGDTVYFTNFATPGVPVFYDFGDGNSTSAPNPAYVYSDPGTYQVVQQAFGCGFDFFETEISVFTPPVAGWVNPTFGCPGDTLYFENTSASVMQFDWDFADGSLGSQEESPQHVFHEPGFYEVCLTVTSSEAPGCTHTLCQTVEIFEPPQAGFEAQDSLCLGDAVLFNSTAVGAVTMCDYQFGDGNGLEECDPSHTYTVPGIFVVTQIVEDANLCHDTIAQQVYVRSLPVAAFSFAAMDLCDPDTIAFTNLSEDAESYLWDFGDGMTSVLTDPVHLYESPGTYTVTLTAFKDGICTDEFTQVLTIEETPQAAIGIGVPSACAGSEVSFTNESTGTFTQQQWDFGDGSFSFDPSPTHTFDAAGTYQVRLITQNGALCADTVGLSLTVHEAVSTTAELAHVLCHGAMTGSIDLTLTGGTEPFALAWSNGGQSEDLSMVPAGVYGVSITDVNACEWTGEFEILQPAALQFSTMEEIVSCFGGNDGSLEIDVEGGVEPYLIEWETGQQGPLIDQLTAGSYSVSITDGNGCVLESEVPLAERAPIEFREVIQHISCYGESDGVIEFDSVFGGLAPYHISLTGGALMEGGWSLTRFDSLPPDIYQLLIADANGCELELDAQILEPAPIEVDIEKDSIQLVMGESEVLNTFYNAVDPVFQWFPINDLDCTDCPNPVAAPRRDVVYTILMTDENGCQAADTVVIDVEIDRDVFIPTVFTPNGDVRNDIFRVRSEYPVSIRQINVFRVFDRWGEMVFEVKDVPPNDRLYGWDGSFRGRQAEPGVYVYYVEVEYVDDEITQWKGEVLLVR